MEEHLRQLVNNPRKLSKNKATSKRSSKVELPSRVQCIHCHRYVTPGHVYCYCGRILVHVNPNPVIEEQIRRNVKQQFDLLTAPAFLLVKDQTVLHSNNKQEARPNTLFEASQTSIGWTEEQVEQMDVSGFEDHTSFATKEERQRYCQIWIIKRNKNGYTPERRNTYQQGIFR